MSSHLIEILLPTADNEGRPYPDALVEGIKQALVDGFGGVTAFTRSPAEGVWAAGHGKQRDDIVTLEVMVAELDKAWWRSFRRNLEGMLRQEKIVVRAFPILPLTD